MAEGMRKGLTRYGDPEFSLFLRKAFIKAMGHSDEALSRPIVGIANAYSCNSHEAKISWFPDLRHNCHLAPTHLDSVHGLGRCVVPPAVAAAGRDLWQDLAVEADLPRLGEAGQLESEGPGARFARVVADRRADGHGR